MKIFFTFIVFLLLEVSIFSVPNRVITGQINTLVISESYIFTTSVNDNNEALVSFKTNETDKNIKLYEISETKGNYNIVSFVSL